MHTYEFTIIVGGVDISWPQFEDPFYEAGCNDCLIGVTVKTMYLEFMREANSAEEAVTSAIANTHSAGAQVIAINEAGPVTLSAASDIADINELELADYISGKKGKGNFPPPIYIGATPIWSWISIARWLNTEGKISKQKIELAEYLHTKHMHQ